MKKIAFLLIALTVSIFFTSCTQPDSPTPQKKEFTITFNDGSGNTYTQVFVEGTPQNLSPLNFTMPSGKGFSGWTTTQGGTSVEYKNGASFSATKDDTLYPVWVDNILYVTATLSDTEITIKEATDGSTDQLKDALSGLSYALGNITKITIVPPENGARITPETNLASLFYGYQALATLENFDLLDTSSVTDMTSMFNRCTSLENIEFLKDWDTSNVETMSNMFQHCRSLTEVNALKNWNTEKVNNMGHMFSQCTYLTTLDISGDGWNDTKVTSEDSVKDMFKDCPALTEAGVKVGPNITDLVKDAIEAIDLP